MCDENLTQNLSLESIELCFFFRDLWTQLERKPAAALRLPRWLNSPVKGSRTGSSWAAQQPIKSANRLREGFRMRSIPTSGSLSEMMRWCDTLSKFSLSHFLTYSLSLSHKLLSLWSSPTVSNLTFCLVSEQNCCFFVKMGVEGVSGRLVLQSFLLIYRRDG